LGRSLLGHAKTRPPLTLGRTKREVDFVGKKQKTVDPSWDPQNLRRERGDFGRKLIAGRHGFSWQPKISQITGAGREEVEGAQRLWWKAAAGGKFSSPGNHETAWDRLVVFPLPLRREQLQGAVLNIRGLGGRVAADDVS